MKFFVAHLQELWYLGGNNNFLDGNEIFAVYLQELGYLGGNFLFGVLNFCTGHSGVAIPTNLGVIGREVRGGGVQATVYKKTTCEHTFEVWWYISPFYINCR